MMKFVSRRALLAVLAASLSACGAPQMEEGSAPELESMEQAVTSSLSLASRNTYTGETYFTNTVTSGAAPFTYYWRYTEERAWDGSTVDSGWYTGASTEYFYCPRSGTRGQEYFWSLRVEAFAVDNNGISSGIVYRGLPCSLPME